MKKSIRTLIIVALIVAIALVAAIFIFWLPSLRFYVREMDSSLALLSELVYPISSVIALLSLAPLAVALTFPSEMKKDRIFSEECAFKLSLIALLSALSGALILFCAIALLTIGDRLLCFPLMVISAIIFLVSFMLITLSGYVRSAAKMKEEVDATL